MAVSNMRSTKRRKQQALVSLAQKGGIGFPSFRLKAESYAVLVSRETVGGVWECTGARRVPEGSRWAFRPQDSRAFEPWSFFPTKRQLEKWLDQQYGVKKWKLQGDSYCVFQKRRRIGSVTKIYAKGLRARRNRKWVFIGHTAFQGVYFTSFMEFLKWLSAHSVTLTSK